MSMVPSKHLTWKSEVTQISHSPPVWVQQHHHLFVRSSSNVKVKSINLGQTVWLTKEKPTSKPIVKIKLSSYTKCPPLLFPGN